MIGLDKDQYLFLIQTVVKPLTQVGARVYCFGSRARGEADPYSDIDLMVVSEKSVDLEISDIRETLEQSNFPFVVELVDERRFAESYKPNYLADRVELCLDGNLS